MTDEESRVADPVTYYDALGEDEYERLEATFAGELEFEHTLAELEAALPDSGHVLDAGGGAGRYADWLLERGYDVTLLDASSAQLRVAREKVGVETPRDLDLLRGSITDLPHPADHFDATLCLGGPLSHVLDADGREAATAELARVTAPGAPVLASDIGRLNVLQNICWNATETVAVLADLARDGDYDASLLERHGLDSSFVATHFFRAAEFRELLESGGLAVDEVVGLEGFASLPGDLGRLADLTDDEREVVAAAVDALRRDEAVADLSAHILAVCEA